MVVSSGVEGGYEDALFVDVVETLWTGDEVEKEDTLCRYAMLLEDLNRLHRRAAGGLRWRESENGGVE